MCSIRRPALLSSVACRCSPRWLLSSVRSAALRLSSDGCRRRGPSLGAVTSSVVTRSRDRQEPSPEVVSSVIARSRAVRRRLGIASSSAAAEGRCRLELLQKGLVVLLCLGARHDTPKSLQGRVSAAASARRHGTILFVLVPCRAGSARVATYSLVPLRSPVILAWSTCLHVPCM